MTRQFRLTPELTHRGNRLSAIMRVSYLRDSLYGLAQCQKFLASMGLWTVAMHVTRDQLATEVVQVPNRCPACAFESMIDVTIGAATKMPPPEDTRCDGCA